MTEWKQLKKRRGKERKINKSENVIRGVTMSILTMLLTWLRSLFDNTVDFLYRLYYTDNKKVLISPVKDEILMLSATKLAAGIRNRKFKSYDVTKVYIERIREVNGILNSLVDDSFAKALEEAKRIDEEIESGLDEDVFRDRPFLGVPFTSKESTHCKGMNVTFGLKLREGIKAEHDADVIKFVKASGAILLGVTNVPQVNLWWETHNPVYGITNNPYDTTRCVGGSSGGESSLISACGSPFGVGTDIGGSIRIPSFMCGIFGHKPTAQLTSTKGLTFRDGTEKDKTMVVAGPMARHAEDLIPGLKAILGPVHKTLDLDRPVDVTKLRYFYALDNGDLKCSPMHAECTDAIKKVVMHLEERSGSMTELQLEDFKYGFQLTKYWLSKESDFAKDITGKTDSAVWHSELFKYVTGRGELDFAAIMLLISNQVLSTPGEDWACSTTNSLKEKLLEKLSDDGVLIFPSMPMTAHHHHASYLRPFNIAYFSVFNCLKLPVTQVPLGLDSKGLPLGVQVVAGPKMDRLTVAVAKELERAFGGYVPPFKTKSN